MQALIAAAEAAADVAAAAIRPTASTSPASRRVLPDPAGPKMPIDKGVSARRCTASSARGPAAGGSPAGAPSLAKTGNAIRLGSNVSPSWELRSLRPSRIRFETSPTPTSGKARPRPPPRGPPYADRHGAAPILR